jgi:hypothetical protein
MARKPLPPIEHIAPTDAGISLPEMAAQDVRVRQAISAQDATIRAVATQLGYQLPADCTDPDLIQRDIAANMRRSVEACLEVGRGLRVLKEACEHGQFMTRLEVLGIETRVAQRFMASAVKFANAASTPLLKAVGNQTKLFEMLVLDDEQIEELELHGQTGELKLDDIATMSVKELRAALRTERQEAQEKQTNIERLIEQKQLRADQLADELDQIKAGGKDAEAALQLATEADFQNRLFAAQQQVLAAHRELAQVVADCLVEPTESRQTLAETTVQWVFQNINEIALTHEILVDFKAIVVPEWMRTLYGLDQPVEA